MHNYPPLVNRNRIPLIFGNETWIFFLVYSVESFVDRVDRLSWKCYSNHVHSLTFFSATLSHNHTIYTAVLPFYNISHSTCCLLFSNFSHTVTFLSLVSIPAFNLSLSFHANIPVWGLKKQSKVIWTCRNNTCCLSAGLNMAIVISGF